MTEPTPDKTVKADDTKHSLGSRIGFALAFSTVGFKLGTLGLLADGAAVLRGEKMTFGEKLGSVFNGKLMAKITEQLRPEDRRSWGALFKASLRLMKYSYILSGIGMAAGGMLGWERGGRVEHVGDIFKHPIDSLKLVLGSKPKGSENQAMPAEMPASDLADASTRWRDTVNAGASVPPVSAGRG